MTRGLAITGRLVLPEDEIQVETVRSGGPGGQNVNKVATKVVLRFNALSSRALDEVQKQAVKEHLGHRLTAAGDLVLHASRQRQRSRNLEEARSRLAKLLADALRPRRPRRATRPTGSSRKRRLESKRRRGTVKRGRGGPGLSD